MLRQATLAARGGAVEDFDLALPGEWEVNPALLHVLANEFEVRVEDDASLDLLDLFADQIPPDASALFERLVEETANVPSFSMSDRVVLANFSNAKLPVVNVLTQAQDLLPQNILICSRGFQNASTDVPASVSVVLKTYSVGGRSSFCRARTHQSR